MAKPKELPTVDGVEFFFKQNTSLFDMEDQVDAYAHGCNVQGLMGAGIALQFRGKYPSMHESYKQLCKNHNYTGDLCGKLFLWNASEPRIYNLFTQKHPGRHAKYEYVRSAFELMFESMMGNDLTSVAMPLIGCGIGGLKWTQVFTELVEAVRKTGFKGTIYICIQDNSDPFH